MSEDIDTSDFAFCQITFALVKLWQK